MTRAMGQVCQLLLSALDSQCAHQQAVLCFVLPLLTHFTGAAPFPDILLANKSALAASQESWPPQDVHSWDLHVAGVISLSSGLEGLSLVCHSLSLLFKFAS